MTDLATAFVPRIGSEAAQRCAPRLAVGGASFLGGLGIVGPRIGSVVRTSSSFGRSLGLSQVQRWSLEPVAGVGSSGSAVRPPIDYWPFADDADAVGAASRREVTPAAPEPPSPARVKPSGGRSDRVDALRRMLMRGGSSDDGDDARGAATASAPRQERTARSVAPDHGAERARQGHARPIRRGLPITMRRQGRTWAGPATAPGRTATTAAPQPTGSVPSARVEPTRAERSERSAPGDGAQEERRAVRSVRSRRADPAELLRRALQTSGAVPMATDVAGTASIRRSVDRRGTPALAARTASVTSAGTTPDAPAPASVRSDEETVVPLRSPAPTADAPAIGDAQLVRTDLASNDTAPNETAAIETAAIETAAIDPDRRPGSVVRRLGTAIDPDAPGGSPTSMVPTVSAVSTSSTPELGTELGDGVRDLAVAPPRSADRAAETAAPDGGPARAADPLRPLPLATVARRLPERRTNDRLTVRRLVERPDDSGSSGVAGRPAGGPGPGDRPIPAPVDMRSGRADTPAARSAVAAPGIVETGVPDHRGSAVDVATTAGAEPAVGTEIVVSARIGETHRSRIRRSVDGSAVSLTGHPLLSSLAATDLEHGDGAPPWRPLADVDRMVVAPNVPAAMHLVADDTDDAGVAVAADRSRPGARRADPSRPDRRASVATPPEGRTGRREERSVLRPDDRPIPAPARPTPDDRPIPAPARPTPDRPAPLVDARPGSLLGPNLLRRRARSAAPYRLTSFAALLDDGRTTDAAPWVGRVASPDQGPTPTATRQRYDGAVSDAVRPAVARSVDGPGPVDEAHPETQRPVPSVPTTAAVAPRPTDRVIRRDLGGAVVEVPADVTAAMATVRPASAPPMADPGVAARSGAGDDVDLVGDRLQRAALLGRDGRPAATAVRARANDLAERFLAELVRHRDERPEALPTVFRSIADVIIGGRTAYVSTSEASRRALAAVGKQAATTGDVVHLADPALLRRPGAQATTILAHELTHVAHAAPEPRFFDDDRDSAEERRAHQIGELMRSAPLAPRVIGAPMSSTTATGSTAAAVVRRAPAGGMSSGGSSSSGSGTVSAEQLAARLTGSPSPSTTIRRSPDSGTPIRRAESGTAIAPTTDTSGQSDDGGSSDGTETTMSHREFERLLRDHFDLIVDLLEQRIIVDLERRGGRYRGDF